MAVQRADWEDQKGNSRATVGLDLSKIVGGRREGKTQS